MSDGILARAEQVLGGVAPERCSAVEIERYQQWLRDGGPGDLVAALRDGKARQSLLFDAVLRQKRRAIDAMAERDEARAAIVRVRALADRWEGYLPTAGGFTCDEAHAWNLAGIHIRRALDGEG
ncbi:hypothetical protein [Tomitella gaofuii]|uniref:hypothetical protein n=1 Tax=Tomitella gaofuii TaxID=2760083 RepID=UPI0015FA180C|nr:hypothetical protein [Tomitella gaofuii]